MSRARLVANRDIVDGSIVDADINASAAIAATKVSGLSTHTSATSGVHGATGTIVGTSDSQTLTNKTLSSPVLLAPEERCNVVAASATGTINLDFLTAGVWFYTSNAGANHTLNIRGNASSTLSSLLAVGDSITVVWMNTNGATPYYPSVIQVDGSNVTPKWQGGTAPSSGNASSIDAYTFTVIKTAATPTYTVLGSQTQFK